MNCVFKGADGSKVNINIPGCDSNGQPGSIQTAKDPVDFYYFEPRKEEFPKKTRNKEIWRVVGTLAILTAAYSIRAMAQAGNRKACQAKAPEEPSLWNLSKKSAANFFALRFDRINSLSDLLWEGSIFGNKGVIDDLNTAVDLARSEFNPSSCIHSTATPQSGLVQYLDAPQARYWTKTIVTPIDDNNNAEDGRLYIRDSYDVKYNKIVGRTVEFSNTTDRGSESGPR